MIVLYNTNHTQPEFPQTTLHALNTIIVNKHKNSTQIHAYLAKTVKKPYN